MKATLCSDRRSVLAGLQLGKSSLACLQPWGVNWNALQCLRPLICPNPSFTRLVETMCPEAWEAIHGVC